MLEALAPNQWNETTAAHLLNRAGFGGTPMEVTELVKLGVEKAVDRLVQFDAVPDPTSAPVWAKPDPTQFARRQEMRQMERSLRSASEEERKLMEQKRREMQRSERQDLARQMTELRHSWLVRMRSGPRPLQEKLTLFWHGHFATSVTKVRDAYFMWLQNETLRRNAAGRWPTLLTEVAQDPAMLLWLDQAQSRKQNPNENFARELMELFTLGEGNYTEKDVTESARALTGWSLNRERQQFVSLPGAHDSSSKTFLGRSGKFNGADVIRIIVEQNQAARFICAKLWRFFAEENPSEDLINALAANFRKGNLEFKPLLRTLFLSKEFYAPAVIRNQVKSPVQWLVGSVRLLERPLPSPSECHQILTQLGQELFNPPNVKGWDGGVSWITTNNLLMRFNFAAALVMGPEAARMPPPRKVAKPKGKAKGAAGVSAMGRPPVDAEQIVPLDQRSNEKLIPALEKRFLQGKLKERQVASLREYIKSQAPLDNEDILNAIRLLMSTPEYQLT